MDIRNCIQVCDIERGYILFHNLDPELKAAIRSLRSNAHIEWNFMALQRNNALIKSYIPITSIT